MDKEITKYILIGLASSVFLLSKDLKTVGSKSHNKLGRLGGFAVVDFVAVALISYFFKLNFFYLIITGIITHAIFCIKTPLNTLLNLNFC